MAVNRDDVDVAFQAGRRIVNHLRRNRNGSSKILLYGSMGCGKTTELFRIQRELAQDFLVVGMDLSQNQVELQELTAEEMTLLIGLAIARAADLVWGLPLEEQVLAMEKAIAPLQGEKGAAKLSVPKMLQSMLLFGAANVGAAGLVDLAMKTLDALSWDFPLGGVLKKTNDRRPGLALVEAVNRLVDVVSEKGTRPPLVIVDQFDKIKSPDVSRAALSHNGLLTSLKCPIVIASPNNLVYTALEGEYKTYCLYHISCWQSDHMRSPNQVGRRKLSDVILRRKERVGNTALLSGPTEEILIENSGGSIRDLIRLLRLSAEWALEERCAQRIELEDADQAIKQLRRWYRLRPLDDSCITCLRQTARAQNLPDSSLAYELLNENLILRYNNGDMWYYPHSILMGYVNPIGETKPC